MDYTGYKITIYNILIFLTIITVTKGHIDRDIILTPNRTHHYAGKILYFNPIDINNIDIIEHTQKHDKAKENVTTTTSDPSSSIITIPWEQPLKHAIYLVLNNKVDHGNLNSSDSIKKDSIEKAAYIRRGPQTVPPRFGDILSLASGWLEKTRAGNFQFVEMDHQLCKKNCTNEEANHRNVSAFWLVEKIRHRDIDRGHRYELRVTIFPLKKMSRSESKRNANPNHLPLKARSFVIRDHDYPKYFADDNGKSSHAPQQIQKRFFDIGPSYDDYRVPFTLNSNYQTQNLGAGQPFKMALNTGEYVPIDDKRQPQHGIQAFSSASNQISGIRLPVEGKLFPNNLGNGNYASTANGLTATHLHHHYYLNKNQVPVTKISAIEKENIYEEPQSFKPSSPYNGNFLPLQIIHGNEQQLLSPPPSQSQHNSPNNIYGLQPENPYSGPPLDFPNQHQLLYHQPTPYPFASLQAKVPLLNNIENQDNQSKSQKQQQSDQQQPNQPEQQQPIQQQAPPFYPLSYMVYGPTPNPGQYLEILPQNQQQYGNNIFSPYGQVDPRLLNRPPSILASNSPSSQPHLLNPQQQFNGNPQYENPRFSEPDPIFHSRPIGLQHQTAETTGIGYEPSGYDVETFEQANLPTQPTGNEQIYQNQKQTDKPSTATAIQSDISTHSSSSTVGNHRQRPSTTTSSSYPDSINAQLPPPEQGDDLTVPYVDSSRLNHKVARTTIQPPPSSSTSITSSVSREEKTTMKVSSENRTAQSPTIIKLKRGRNRASFATKQTTEKPILKWMPKRIRQSNASSTTSTSTTTQNATDYEAADEPITSLSPITSSTVTTQLSTMTGPMTDGSAPFSTTERVYTVTPINSLISEESQTSISTSISIEVGTSAPSAEITDNQIKRSLPTSATNEITNAITTPVVFDAATTIDDNENALLPTVRPTLFQLYSPSSNLEMIRGHLETIPTNNSDLRLFKASEMKEKTIGTVDDRIAKSIVNHAKNL